MENLTAQTAQQYRPKANSLNGTGSGKSLSEIAEETANKLGISSDEFIFAIHKEPGEHKPEEKISLGNWVNEVVKDLHKARGILVPLERIKFFIDELKTDNYPDFQRPAARAWIVRGNWQYKSPKVLELTDFYPTEKQLLTLSGASIFLEDLFATFKTFARLYGEF